MQMRLTMTEIICAAVLCLFAVGTTHAADQAKLDRANAYKAAVARADAEYKDAKEACKAKTGHEKDVCLKEAKAMHKKEIADAKAGRTIKTAMATSREDKLEADYKVAKEKCDALSGDAKDSCIQDAKLRYH